MIRHYCGGSHGYAHASPLTEEIMVAVSGSVEDFKKKWTDHLNERFSNIFPDELPQGNGRWLEKPAYGKNLRGERPANVAWDELYPDTEFIMPISPDYVRRLLQDVLDWGLGAELPRFVWWHHFENPPPHSVTLVSDPAPIIGPWETSLWGPNPFFPPPPRPPRPPNEIPFEGIDQINEVGSVVRKWIESPWVISVDVERLYDTSIEDLLILCAVERPEYETLETWKSELGLFGDEDELEFRLHRLMEQASRWLAPGLTADDGEWVRVEFEFGGMASGAVQVAAKPITQGVYAISIDHGLEGQLPSVLGTATTDNLVEDIVGSIGSDPGIGNCWNGPASAPFVTVGGNIPEEQLAAIEAAFKEEEE